MNSQLQRAINMSAQAQETPFEGDPQECLYSEGAEQLVFMVSLFRLSCIWSAPLRPDVFFDFKLKSTPDTATGLIRLLQI